MEKCTVLCIKKAAISDGFIDMAAWMPQFLRTWNITSFRDAKTRLLQIAWMQSVTTLLLQESLFLRTLGFRGGKLGGVLEKLHRP